MEQIPPFEKGSLRTLLLSAEANKLVAGINALIRMRGEGGVKVTVADGNIVLSLTDAAAADTGGGGTGDAWTFRGDWVDQDYAIDDVVIRDSSADIADASVGGTYLAIDTVPTGTPGPGETGSAAFWVLIARGNWERLKFRFPGVGIVDIDTRGTESGSGGQAQILITSEVDTASCLIRLDDLDGKEAKFRQVAVCDGGVAKYMIVLGTAAYV